MQLSIGKVTFRTVLFIVGVILFITGLGYNVSNLNPTGKTDIVLFRYNLPDGGTIHGEPPFCLDLLF